MVDIHNFSLHWLWWHGTKHLLWERSLFAYWNYGKYLWTLFLLLTLLDPEGTVVKLFEFPAASSQAYMIDSRWGENITASHLHSHHDAALWSSRCCWIANLGGRGTNFDAQIRSLSFGFSQNVLHFRGFSIVLLAVSTWVNFSSLKPTFLVCKMGTLITYLEECWRADELRFLNYRIRLWWALEQCGSGLHGLLICRCFLSRYSTVRQMCFLFLTVFLGTFSFLCSWKVDF